MFFDVSFERNEILVNEVGDFLIGVRLSFQLSTCPSGGRGGKIDEQRFVFSLRLRQRSIGIA